MADCIFPDEPIRVFDGWNGIGKPKYRYVYPSELMLLCHNIVDDTKFYVFPDYFNVDFGFSGFQYFTKKCQ